VNPDVQLNRIARLDMRTLEALILREPLPEAPGLAVCYTCSRYSQLAPYRGRLLCDPCKAIEKFRGQ
jgi:hypothetical protein